MNKAELKEFRKRYDEFKNNNLPTPFWDEERQTLEYVHFEHAYNEDILMVNSSLSDALGMVTSNLLFYRYIDKHIEETTENGETIKEVVIGRNRAYSFEEVVKALYNSPESFKIPKEYKEDYSKQELDNLRRMQKYLLFIGMTDLDGEEPQNSRYQNKIQSKYANATVFIFSDEHLDLVNSGKKDFKTKYCFEEYSGIKEYKPGEYQGLIADKKGNIKMFVEFTYQEIKQYKDIKDLEKTKKLKDDEKLRVDHFKILEVFDNKKR